MHLDEAYAVLGCGRTASSAELRTAYRRRAMETHPDRGGSTPDFLRVHCAFDVISNSRGNPASGLGLGDDTRDSEYGEDGLDSLIVEQLRELDAAYERLWRDLAGHIRSQITIFQNEVISHINSYASLRAMRKNANRDVDASWSAFLLRVARYRDSLLADVATIAERGLGEILVPAVDRARSEHPRRWFERYSTALTVLVTMTACEVFGLALPYAIPLWFHTAAACAGVASLWPPLIYGKRYTPTQYMPKIPPSAVPGIHLGQFATPGGVSPRAIGLGGGAVGFWAGAALGGPILGVVLGYLGSLLGNISLRSKQIELFEKVAVAVDSACGEMQKQVYDELLEAKDRMAASIRDTFRTSAMKVARLLGPGPSEAAKRRQPLEWLLPGALALLCLCLIVYVARRHSARLKIQARNSVAAITPRGRKGMRRAGPASTSIQGRQSTALPTAAPAEPGLNAAVAPVASLEKASSQVSAVTQRSPTWGQQPANSVSANLPASPDLLDRNLQPCATASGTNSTPNGPAFANGLHDGYAAGAQDTPASAEAPDVLDSPEYQRGLEGYSAGQGPADQYRADFQSGFEIGFLAGFSEQVEPAETDITAVGSAYNRGIQAGYDLGSQDMLDSAPPNVHKFRVYQSATEARFRAGLTVGYLAGYGHLPVPTVADRCDGLYKLYP